MNRLAGIVVAAVGLAISVLAVLKVLPGLTGPGVLLILTGGLVIGLSFVPRPNADGDERMSTPATLLNIFLSPGKVFRNLRRHPRWLVALIIMSFLSAVYFNLFLYRLTPDLVTNYTIDKSLEMSYVQNNEKVRTSIEEGRPKALEDQKNPLIRGAQAVSGFCGALFGYAFLAAVFFLFVMAMGGQMNYLQALSAVIYAAFPVSVIRFILNSILLFLKDPSDIHPVRGQSTLIQDNLNFLVSPADHPVIFSILGVLGVLWFYWVWLNAIGIKDAGEKVSGSMAWTVALGVYVMLILLVGISGFLFGNFIS